jgi:steroid 5-alpha reductase family enzyme
MMKCAVGSFLFQRILQEGKDSRFDEIKKSPRRFAVAWFAQATWVSLCLLPVIAVNSVPARVFSSVSGLKISDILGLSLYVGGLAFEVVADLQKSKWMRERKEKVHDEEFLTRGLWSKRYVFAGQRG